MIKQKSAFAAAAHVLSYNTLKPYIDGHIDYENKRIEWAYLWDRKSRMSGGEVALVDIALALWNGDTEATIASLSNVSDEPYTRVIEALVALRGLSIMEEPGEIARQAITLFIEDVKNTVPWTGLADLSDELISKSRDAAVREIEEGLAVSDEDLKP